MFTRARGYQIALSLATDWLAAQTYALALAAPGGGRWEHRLHAPFFRLSRLLGSAAAAGQTPAQRVRQRRRVARVATSARGARPAKAAPPTAASRSCLACGARPIASATASPR